MPLKQIEKRAAERLGFQLKKKPELKGATITVSGPQVSLHGTNLTKEQRGIMEMEVALAAELHNRIALINRERGKITATFTPKKTNLLGDA